MHLQIVRSGHQPTIIGVLIFDHDNNNLLMRFMENWSDVPDLELNSVSSLAEDIQNIAWELGPAPVIDYLKLLAGPLRVSEPKPIRNESLSEELDRLADDLLTKRPNGVTQAQLASCGLFSKVWLNVRKVATATWQSLTPSALCYSVAALCFVSMVLAPLAILWTNNAGGLSGKAVTRLSLDASPSGLYAHAARPLHTTTSSSDGVIAARKRTGRGHRERESNVQPPPKLLARRIFTQPETKPEVPEVPMVSSMEVPADLFAVTERVEPPTTQELISQPIRPKRVKGFRRLLRVLAYPFKNMQKVLKK